ncbi:MAG TPA: hypothetical protein ENO16_00455 [Chromatiales bacterium]|nr:hypothetical protein [Chromatiales bacterium]
MPPLSRAPRITALHATLGRRSVIIDGAIGSLIQNHKLDESAYRGERLADWSHGLKDNNELPALPQHM